MPRAKSLRTLQELPTVKGFRPLWMRTNYRRAITLNLEEYEVIRLIDYENLIQEQVAELMNVSRPTVTRIYESARRKLGTAIVEGRTFVIEGGDVQMARTYYQCEDCQHRIALDPHDERPELCPTCGSDRIISLADCFIRGCRRCRRCK
ncbi:MAG: DUF134 domain-containing protein [Candidatus Cloacimonadales bacterium]|nr:DUF134 domain-containing protein [Candidatus Cloacimonadota bacterium]MDY0381678.1 DUF134 domain-containing protein [Candidatus Cloacimonadaceae bacterium]HCM15048.1 DNA-binding protein [Candidatus Cloacimonas sp.]MCB5257374.1 DUF134 domain-containing protein [Candidatus Cloacimonadota bacterium]MCB5263745.1 DUF134 domain-containing protein [Candidatus Cloacimonadota bacterium]